MIINGASGFKSNTLLIRFPIILSAYIVYRMHKFERRMVKTKRNNKGKYNVPLFTTNDLVYDRMK